ncbi:MAG: hypothetical protein SGPRY_004295 [Prymnesium sp.]
MASTLLLPSLVHHTIALLVFPVLGAIAAAASYLALRICASRNPRFKQRCHRLIGSRGTHRAMLQGVGGLVLLTTLLLLLPTPAQADLWVAFNTILESMMGARTAFSGANASESPPLWWHVWGATPERAAESLVNAMSEEERYRLVQGTGWSITSPKPGFFIGSILAVPRLRVPSINAQDAAQGFRTTRRQMTSQVTRVTSWPCGLAAAATWDRALVHTWARALGKEFKAKGANMILGPSVNVHRVATNGRNAEYLSGEDPALGSALGAEYVKAVQAEGVAAVVKHYLLNSQETNRFSSSSNPDERTLQAAAASLVPPSPSTQTYSMPPLDHADEQMHLPSTPPCGVADACGNEHALETVLKSQLDFRGFVMSDWWAVHSTEAAKGGVDQNQPGNDGYFSEGRLSSTQLQSMGRRVLAGMISSGAFNTSACTVGCDCEPWMIKANATSAEHIALARRLASSSAVLLLNKPTSNRNSLLPLRAGDVVALVGSACDAAHEIDVEKDDWMKADYYARRTMLAAHTSAPSAHEYDHPPSLTSSPHPHTMSIRAALSSRGVSLRTSPNEDVSAALKAMEGADLAIACAGATSTEMRDRAHLRLDQHDFLVALSLQATVPLAVAAIAPGAVAVRPWVGGVSALLVMFLAGQETGNAWADVLLGEVNPSGKLPVTFPEREEDVVSPCGSWLTLPQYHVHNRSVHLSARVTNGGDLPGADVAQLYVSFPAHAHEPPLLLRDFSKSRVLGPGEAMSVAFNLGVEQHLSIWGTTPAGDEGWQPVSGLFEISIGSSSRDLRLKHKVQVDA